jgi:ArsR family transcriptional regulator, arsenate/arsenite/antimonite-responsive transcriptional repressor
MKDLLLLFKTLGDEKRIKIVGLLLEREHCVCELIELLNLSQPTVSHHLKIMKKGGLLNERRRGTWNYYSLKKEGFAASAALLEERLFLPVAQSSFRECPSINKKC